MKIMTFTVSFSDDSCGMFELFSEIESLCEYDFDSLESLFSLKSSFLGDSYCFIYLKN